MTLFRSTVLAVVAIAVLACGLPAAEPLGEPADPAPAGIYFADPAHTSVTWSLRHIGLSHYTARFVAPEATLDWRPEAPESSSLSVRIEPASVRTDFPWPEHEDFDGKIAKGEDFLANRLITFVSTRIERTGPASARVLGDLTLRGETHPAVLEVVLNGSMDRHPATGRPRVGFSATGSIRRSDWGMTALLPMVGDDVRIVIEAELGPDLG